MTLSGHVDQATIAIVIAAAGSGRRFGGDKMSATIGETTVLEAAVGRLRAALPGAPVVVVVDGAAVERWRSIIANVEFVAGGDRRQDSVRNGVDAVLAPGVETVVIHDGARPVVHLDDIRAVVNAIDDVDGVVLCARVTDTVKRAGGGNMVIETLDRDSLRLVQTPQVFRVAALMAAWDASEPGREWSDEAVVLETAGFTVRAVAAEHPNPKITTAADLELVRALIGAGS